MPSQIELDELNNVSVRTHGVVNLNVGSIDAPNISVGPLVALRPGTNAFLKFNQLHVVDMNGAENVSGFKFWMSGGSLVTGESIQTNLTETPGEYVPATYSVPTSDRFTGGLQGIVLPAATPAAPNLGIAGSLSGILTAPGLSDLFCWQIQLAKTVPVGALKTKQFSWSWDEDIVEEA